MSADDIKPVLTDEQITAHYPGFFFPLPGSHIPFVRVDDLIDFARNVEAAAIRAAAGSISEASHTYLGADVAERLDSMADDQAPRSQAQSDLFAAATVWRKHMAGTTVAQPQGDDAPFTDDNRHPFGADRRGDWIVVAVSLNTLRHATQACPHLEYYPDNGSHCVMPIITDMDAFAVEFVRALNNEAEDGSTLVTKAFDEAIELAVENGAEGIAVDEEAAQLRAAMSPSTGAKRGKV